MMTRLELFCYLGYKRDPFLGVSFRTGDVVRAERILTMAVESRAMVSIVGERGIGKSDAVKSALDKMKIKRVTVERLDKEGLTIGDIKTALILDLSTEGIKRGGETSSRQLRRIVGEASMTKKQKIVVIVEEAQRLHANTLRSLKSLREMEYLGEREMFTIILVAQSDPMNRPGVSEVSLRSDCVRMQGLSAEEAAGYIRATIGKHFEDSAIDALAELPTARNFLELQKLCVAILNNALAEGREQATTADVTATAGAQQAAPLPTTPRKQAAAPVSGKEALASVLGRNRGTSEQQGAVNA
jgi:type II secretory pathway predicted ATPase ExeA